MAAESRRTLSSTNYFLTALLLLVALVGIASATSRQQVQLSRSGRRAVSHRSSRNQLVATNFAGQPPNNPADELDTINCTVLFHQQVVDHFAFHNNGTFLQRYVMCDKYYKAGGPILFYTGNEGDILLFANNTGFMLDIAPEFNALVIFAEHRYYGTSNPQDPPPLPNGQPQRFYYQSVVQVLADYNELILHIKRTIHGGNESAVIVMGGSYGGMLAAWFRMKYPGTADGALASSAPIWGAPGLSECGFFARIATNDFKAISPICSDNIRRSWDVLNKLGESADGQKLIIDKMRLCGRWDVDVKLGLLKAWLAQAWSYMAMVDYPYSADFLTPMPGWPVQASCQPLLKPLKDPAAMADGLRQAMHIFYNYTGEAGQCFNLSQPLGSLGSFMDQWTYQSCTELAIPACSDGVQDMFEPMPWDPAQFTDTCQQLFGVSPNYDFVVDRYGGKKLTYYSNIIFSNGNLDPWSGGGVLQNVSDSIVSILIDQGAHHLDLRGADPRDPPSVVAARNQEKIIMRQWIAEKSRQIAEQRTHRPSNQFQNAL